MGSKGNRLSNPMMFVMLLINAILVRKIGNCEEELPKPTQCRPTVGRRVTNRLPTSYRQVTNSFLRQKVCCRKERNRVSYPINKIVSETRKQIVWSFFCSDVDGLLVCALAGALAKTDCVPTDVRQTADRFFFREPFFTVRKCAHIGRRALRRLRLHVLRGFSKTRSGAVRFLV